MNQKTPRAMIKMTEKIVDLMVMLLLLIVLLYGGYSMWDTNRMYSFASSTAYAAYRPVRGEEIGFEQLQEENSNIFGWLSVFGTNIDYPLLQGSDNLRYVHTNARGEPAMSGAIFLDFRNDQGLTDFNNIIYGHDMARGAMFGDIANFEQDYFFETRRYGMVFTGIEYYGLEIFAFLLVDAHDSEIYNPTMVNLEVKEAFLQRIATDATQFHDIDITVNDRLIILSTCTPTITNGRHILIARLLDEVPEDTFDGVRTGHGTDRLFGLLDINPVALATGSLLVVGVAAAGTISLATKKKTPDNSTFYSIEEEIEAELAKEAGRKHVKKRKPTELQEMPKQQEVTNPQESKKPKKPLTLMEEFLFLFGKIAMILIVIALLFTFVFGATQVNDATMSPAMREGDIVFFQRTGQNFIATDAVVVRYEGQTQVRRVAAVAGDIVDITDQGLFINDLLQQEVYIFEETTQFVEGITFPLIVPEGEVFVLGDSRGHARDSRIYGTVRTDDILGSVVTVIRRRNL